MWIGQHLEIQPPILCLVTEGPRDHFEDAGKEDIFGLHRNRPRFDLGKIQNVADQVQQVSPRAMNRSGEFNLLGGEVLVRVVAELLAKNENAVQGLAQFPGSCVPPRRSARRAAGLFAPTAHWSAAILFAGFEARWPVAGIASAILRSASLPQCCSAGCRCSPLAAPETPDAKW